MRGLLRIFISWLPLAIAITGVSALVYGAVQQNYRQTLNDPQEQMAEDMAYRLAHGAIPADVVPHDQVDIARSLAPFVGVYDEQGAVIATNGTLDGASARPPEGVFEYARTHESNLPHDTWQPKEGVRMATVIVHIGDGAGFVAVGRNMRQVEDRISQLGGMVLLIGGFLLITTFILKGIARYIAE